MTPRLAPDVTHGHYKDGGDSSFAKRSKEILSAKCGHRIRRDRAFLGFERLLVASDLQLNSALIAKGFAMSRASLVFALLAVAAVLGAVDAQSFPQARALR